MSGRAELTPASRAQMEEYCRAHKTQVLTILFSDLEGSTRQQSELGNVRAAELVDEHRRIFREALRELDGCEVETAGDSFLAVFAAPSEGVRFALRLQAAMRGARAATPELPSVRVGLHQGQVVVREHAEGPKPLDIYGVQVSTAARIMDLARGGQILCTRAVFDDARAILRGSDLAGLGPVAWCNHGPYRFKGVADSYDVCEVGEEGVAPLLAPAASGKSWPAGDGPECGTWRPAAGVVVPGTNWVLEERLGKEAGDGGRFRGEFGEVWRARSPAAKSLRAFKFCFKRDRVPALKREARLFEHLRELERRHPNLVEVYNVVVGERPPHYLEMEYVEGPLLEEWLATNPPLAERLEVIAQVADALDTVHAAGIYHRDIKPSNILLKRHADGPLQAKLTDFGLGAAEDAEVLKSVYASRVDGVAGTWDYIAPELREGGKASAQSDLYSLGVTLFQVVTGNLKVQTNPGWEAEVESDVLREDIAKCMDREPSRRWARAEELATGLRNHDARLAQRLSDAAHRRRVRRWKIAAAVVGLFALVAVGFGLFAGYHWRQAKRLRGIAEGNEAEAVRQAGIARQSAAEAREKRKEAEDQRSIAEARLYSCNILLSQQYLKDNQHKRAWEFLWEAPESQRNWEWGFLIARAHQFRFSVGAVGEYGRCAKFSPDGRYLAAEFGGSLRLLDAQTGRLVRELTHLEEELWWLDFSRDGLRILAVSRDGFPRVLDVETGKLVRRFEEIGEGGIVRLSPDGGRVFSDQGVWDANTGKRLHPLEGIAVAERDGVATVSPDGQLAIGRAEGTMRAWSLETGKVVHQFDAEDQFAKRSTMPADFSPDSRSLVVALSDGTARVWDTRTWALVKRLGKGGDGVTEARFSPDGRWIATAAGALATVWEVANGESRCTLNGHSGSIADLVFSPDGKRLVTALTDKTARVWDTDTGEELNRLKGHAEFVCFASFSRDGSRILTLSNDAMVWDWESCCESFRCGRPEHSLPPRKGMSPDGRCKAEAELFHATVRVLDALSGTLIHTLKGHTKDVCSVQFSPDGRRLVTGSSDGTGKVWDCRTGKETLTLKGHRFSVLTARFSPDGRFIVTASFDKTARVWDSETGKELLRLAGHPMPLVAASFSPDGRRIATIADNAIDPSREYDGRFESEVRLWDSGTGKQILSFSVPLPAGDILFNPDGSGVIVISKVDDLDSRIWLVPPWRTPDLPTNASREEWLNRWRLSPERPWRQPRGKQSERR